jgi:predicted Zn-dependent protease
MAGKSRHDRLKLNRRNKTHTAADLLPARLRGKILATAITAALPFQFSFAAPYRPDHDALVLERLPTAPVPEKRELRRLRQQLATLPDQPELAVDLAERYIARGKAEADPRYYGYAEGLLNSWRQTPEPPPKVLLLNALIKQHRHDFNGALQDLDALLRREPDNAQAWLARAVILVVQARYGDALRSCAPLIALDDTLLAGTCLAQVNSLSGQAQKSYDFLLDALTDQPETSAEQRQWTLTVLADIAARLGKTVEAEKHFSVAAGIDHPNVYLFGAYADFLLDHNQPQKVLSLLQDKSRIDALFLRIVLAKHQLAANDSDRVTEELEARFAASRMRGDNLHQGDEARFMLHVLNKPEEALRLAVANWQVQREPKDARILLEAALAARNAEAAKPVLDLLAATGMENPQLHKLAAQVGQLR